MKCLVWICGLHGSQFNDVRELALQYVEDNPKCTLRQLHQQVKNFTRLQSASKAIEGASSLVVNKVAVGKSPRPCRGCGGPHFRDACPVRNQDCRCCGKRGHVEAVCCQKSKNQNGKKNDKKGASQGRHGKPKGNSINSIEMHGLGAESSRHKISKDVSINGKILRMRMDTGADVTVISVKDWETLGSPALYHCDRPMKAANEGSLDCRGYFPCSFVLERQTAEGNC